jgi:hypothetical protein
LIWWRTHPEQEINKEKRSFEPTFLRYQLDKDSIISDLSPLNQIEKTTALKKLNRRFVFNILNHFIKNVDIVHCVIYYSKSKIGFVNLFKAFFH